MPLKNRIPLAHLPTPLWHHSQLDALVGSQVWVKRDDMTGGAEAGNKLRKLEYLLFAARERGARVVLTCGGSQSNHARATALCARQLGMRALLLLRTQSQEVPVTGNLLLDRMSGAEIHYITPEQYASRDTLLAEHAERLQRAGESAYVIPEGGSCGLGALGYVAAAAEIHTQLALGLAGGIRRFDWIVAACGSGGTTAGLALGAAHHGIADEVRGMAVCDNEAYFDSVTRRISEEALALESTLAAPVPVKIVDGFIGPGYGVMDAEQRAFLLSVARNTGLILDPVYSGKALFALAKLEHKPARVLFVHTGGLPGLLAQADQFGQTG
jgi:D-cysteine desulfhydrase